MQRRRRITTALLVAGAVGLAACGGGGGDDGVATLGGDAAGSDSTDSADTDPEEAYRKWAECMRDQGVDVPDPEVDSETGSVIVARPGGQATDDPAAFEAAQEVCQKHIASVVNSAEGRPRDPEAEAEMQEYALEFAACMREQGIDFPDPSFEGGRTTQTVPDSVDPAALEAAQRHCEEELGERPGGGEGPQTGTGGGGGGPRIGVGGDE